VRQAGGLQPVQRDAEAVASAEGGSLSDSQQQRGWRPWLPGVLGAAWVILALAAIAGVCGSTLYRYYTDPQVARDDYRGIAHFIVATSDPEDAILLVAPGQSEVFDYYYHGELPVHALPRQRPMDEAATQAELIQLLQHDRIYAVYWATAEADPGGFIESWMNHWGYKTLDQWRGNVRLAVYVMPERREPEESVGDLHAMFGSDILLEGYEGWNLTLTAGQVTQLKLRWRALEQPDARYKVFLQLLDVRDQVIAQRDAEPAGESQPTDGWQPGDIIEDNHGLLIPPGTPPGAYRRILGLYNLDTMERLRLPDGSDFINLTPITVTRAKSPAPLAAMGMRYTQRFSFGAITLLGHDRYKRGFGHAPDEQILPGDLLHLTFYWQARVSPRAEWWFELTLSDREGQEVASVQAPLVSDTYPTTAWLADEIVRGEHDLRLPDDLAPGVYRLSLTLLPDLETEAGPSAYLGSVRIQAPAER
jgi:hypothetical protein